MALRLTLTGVGAMASPRFAPAGLLVEYDGIRVVLDGGGDPGSFPAAVDGWLVTDERSELIREIRELARERGAGAGVERFSTRGLTLDPMPVIHTSHPTFGYSIRRGAPHRLSSRVLRLPGLGRSQRSHVRRRRGVGSSDSFQRCCRRSRGRPGCQSRGNGATCQSSRLCPHRTPHHQGDGPRRATTVWILRVRRSPVRAASLAPMKTSRRPRDAGSGQRIEQKATSSRRDLAHADRRARRVISYAGVDRVRFYGSRTPLAWISTE